VGNIKETGGGADSAVFLHDAGVLDGHFPPPEINQAGAQFLVGRVKWRSLQHGFSISALGVIR
jgi:hypothetical protein